MCKQKEIRATIDSTDSMWNEVRVSSDENWPADFAIALTHFFSACRFDGSWHYAKQKKKMFKWDFVSLFCFASPMNAQRSCVTSNAKCKSEKEKRWVNWDLVRHLCKWHQKVRFCHWICCFAPFIRFTLLLTAFSRLRKQRVHEEKKRSKNDKILATATTHGDHEQVNGSFGYIHWYSLYDRRRPCKIASIH